MVYEVSMQGTKLACTGRLCWNGDDDRVGIPDSR